MQDRPRSAPNEPKGHFLASPARATAGTQSNLNRQLLQESHKVTRGRSSSRPRQTQDQRMRRFLVNRHFRSVIPRRAVSPLHDPNQAASEPSSGLASEGDEVNVLQEQETDVQQTSHRVGQARSALPTRDPVPYTQKTVSQRWSSATSRSAWSEDTKGPSPSTTNSNRFSRSVIPSPLLYASSATSPSLL